MYPLFRSLLFHLDPERAHALTLSLMRLAGALAPMREVLRRWFAAPPSPVSAFGLQFSNPIGLAAGYDKDGLAWRGMACLGFGHIEVGTVTPHSQPGNPAPRLFRLPQDRALINRLGFPGKGAAFVARQLQGKRPGGLVLGVNLGKNKDTSNEHAVEDYLTLLRIFAPLSDYLAINVSSPNTEGLRRLQAREALENLLGALIAERQEANLPRHIPLLVKLAPDLTVPQLEDALDVIVRLRVDGVIDTNTTTDHSGLCSPFAKETGGLSGAPLRERSTRMVHLIHQITGGKLPIIGVGGVMSPRDAQEKLDAGAALVQIYTGLVYSGPGLIKQILLNL